MLRGILISIALCLICAGSIAAVSFENVDIKVGESVTCSLPGEVISKDPYSVSFVALSPSYADISSHTASTVTIVGRKSIQSRVIVRCNYYYQNDNGLGGRGFYDFKVLVCGDGSGDEGGFRLDETSLRLSVGERRQLKYDFGGGASASVTWMSSNPEAADVDETGTVIARKAGNTIIYAMTTQSRTATCEVTVVSGSGSENYSDGDLMLSVSEEGHGMYYQVTSAGERTCRIGFELGNTLCGSPMYLNPKNPSVLTVPEYVNGYKVTDAMDGAFAFIGYTELESIVLPQTLTRIGSSLFKESKYVKSVWLPEGIKEIPLWTFQGCKELANVYIPSSVEVIWHNSFEGTALKSFIVPYDSDLSMVYSRSFSDCGMLEEVDFGRELFYIYCPDGEGIFENCDNLRSLTIGNENMVCISSDIFGKSSYLYDRVILKVPDHMVEAYRNSYPWSMFSRIVPIGESLLDDVHCQDDPLVKYYDLNGREMQNPDRGIYIRRVNGKNEKVIL